MRIMKAVGLDHSIENCRLQGNRTRYKTIQYGAIRYNFIVSFSLRHRQLTDTQKTHKLDIEMTQTAQTYKSAAATAVTI